jgi:hypothetical protein
MASAPLLNEMFSDITLSDPDEMMKVTNTGKIPLEWAGYRRVYILEPGKPVFIPFHVVVRYMGDPRSVYKKTESFVTPSGDRGVIPERRAELVRLSIWYGLYHDKIRFLPQCAPSVTVTTLTDRVLQFPINDPDSVAYGYNTMETQNIDVRTELDRVKSQLAALEQRQQALTSNLLADDGEAGEATPDTPPGM